MEEYERIYKYLYDACVCERDSPLCNACAAQLDLDTLRASLAAAERERDEAIHAITQSENMRKHSKEVHDSVRYMVEQERDSARRERDAARDRLSEIEEAIEDADPGSLHPDRAYSIEDCVKDLVSQRDTALARVRDLEAQVAEPKGARDGD